MCMRFLVVRSKWNLTWTLKTPLNKGLIFHLTFNIFFTCAQKRKSERFIFSTDQNGCSTRDLNARTVRDLSAKTVQALGEVTCKDLLGEPEIVVRIVF